MKYKTISTTDLGFSFPCLSSDVTKARMKKYDIDIFKLDSACNNIIKMFEVDYEKSLDVDNIVYKRKPLKKKEEDNINYYIDFLERFIASDISLYDTTFLGIKGHWCSITASAVPLENKFKQAKKLTNLYTQ